MLPRLPLAALVVAGIVVAGAAGAAEPKPVLNRLDLNKVGLPVVWRGRVVNYVFVTVRLDLAPARDGQVLRPKEPYFRDALVRAGHRAPLVDAADLSRVDERALDAALLPEARRIAGPGWVTAVEVVSQQPRRRLPRPTPDAPQGRPITP